MLRVLTLTISLLGGTAVAAPPPDIDQTSTEPATRGEGKFAATKGSLAVHLTIVYLENQQYAGHLTAVGNGGQCIDSWVGLGKWQDSTKLVGLTSMAYLSDTKRPQQEPKEQVFLTYNRKKNTYSIKESDNVNHGLNCTFEVGELSMTK